MKAKPGDILRCMKGENVGWTIEIISNNSYIDSISGTLIDAPYIKFDEWEMDDTVWRLDEATMVDRIVTKYSNEM